MKLSVAAYRASASNVNRRLSSLNGRPRPRTSSTPQMARSVSWGSSQVENAEEVSVPPGPPSAPPTPPTRLSRELNVHSGDEPPTSTVPSTKEKPEEGEGEEDKTSRKNPPPVRQPSRGTRGTQRWMKLRTTVQLSGAVSSAVKEKKPPLKREDSFLKRFSTRQIAEASETVDNDGESAAVGAAGGGASGIRARVAARRRRRRRAGIGGFDEPLTVINPDENFYFGWLSLLTLCVLYNCWTLIVRQAFPELQRIAHALWVTTDVVSDLVFLCDIGVQFRTGYLEQGLMVYDSKKLAMHYIRSRAFILDLACLLPLDIVQLWTATPNPIIRFPRFLKVYRSYNYYYMVESRTLYPNVWRVVNLIHILLLLAHWFGCFFFLLSEAENFKGNWTYPEPKGDFATLTRKYLGSLYWSTLTLTTIGDLPTPDSDWQYLFTIVSYLIGVFIFATIVGQVGNVITNRNASRLEFERLLDGAKLYMRQHKVPREMQRRVQRWYDYSWSRGRMQGGGDINSALGILPDKLKTELALHVNLNTLKKVSIFQECQPEFLHDLVLKMKAYIFTPGDLICRKGEVAREMFIIADGILQVISETGKVLTTMRAGDFFGEIGILNLDGLNKRTADVRSVGYSELFSLSREDVLTAMKDYPEAQEILQSLGRKRLMEAKLAAAGLKKDTDGDSMKESVGTGDPSAADDRGDGDNEGSRSKALQMMRRIKRDARELRNYLRRGINRDPLPREEAKQTESVRIEMEPLSPGSTEPSVPGSTLSVLEKDSSLRKLLWGKTKEATSGPTRELPSTKAGLRTKGILMRMQKITSQQEPPISDTASIRTPSPPLAGGGGEDEGGGDQQPLGAGLPLFQRLRLLKEREERAKAKGDTAVATSSSTSMSTLPSQPLPLTRADDLSSRGTKEELSPQPPEEPIGAGLPLFQRLRMLKEREEKERAEAERQQTSAISSAAGGAGGGSGKLSLAKAVLLKKLETLREEEKGDGGSGTVEVPTQVTPPPSSPASFPPPTPKTPPPSQKEAEILSKSSPKRVTGGILFAPPPSLKATEFKPEEYLADLLLGVKQVLQTRLEEIQGQFKSRLVSLEEEVKRKNLIIQRLEETLQRCEVKEVYNETHGTSQPLPQTENDTTFPPHKDKDDSHVTASSPGEASFDEDDDYFDDEFEQASDVTHPGYVSHPRRSWPLLPPWSERHRVGVPQRAWESQAALVLDPEHLWRAEFPLEPRVPPLPPAWVAVSTSALNGSSLDDDDERSSRNDDGSEGDASSEDDGQDDLPPPQPQGNQWEIQMLAEQLLSKRHVTDADPTDSDSSGELPKEEGADEGDGEGPRRRGRRKVVRKSRPRKEDRNQRVREEGEEEEEEGGDEEEDDDEDRGSGGLLGVLQQLSPTEQRELERLLAVATRKHLTRQLSLRSSEATLQVPVRRRSVASCATPPTAPSLPPVRRRVPTPLPPPPPPPSTSLPSSAYLHVSAAAPPPSSSSSAGLLLSPPTDDDSVSICIPEYEPLLGPKQ